MSIKISYRGEILEFEKSPTSDEIRISYENKINSNKKVSSLEEKKMLNKKIELQNLYQYPLSSAQRSLWLASQVEGESRVYIICFAINFEGKFNKAAFRYAVQKVMEGHESLRTAIRVKSGIPYQCVESTLKLDISETEITLKDAKKSDDIMKCFAREEVKKGFNLSAAPLFRIKLVKFEEDNNVALVTMHHIISDGSSVAVFVKELGEYYTAFMKNENIELESLNMKYCDYVLDEQMKLNSSYFNEMDMFWKAQFSKELSPLNIPRNIAHEIDATYDADAQILSFDSVLTKQIRDFGRTHSVSSFMILLTALKTLLYRYTGQENIIVGTPITTRSNKDMKRMIGCFINMLALNTSFWGNPTFKEILQRVKNTTFTAIQKKEYPFLRLVEMVNPIRNINSSPIFQVVMSFQKNPFNTMELPGVTMTSYDIQDLACEYDLYLDVIEDSEDMVVKFIYRRDLFQSETINMIMGHFEQILRRIVKEPDLELNKLDLLTEEEYKEIFTEFNGNVLDCQRECIQHLFEEQCKVSPSKIALQKNGDYITYESLNKRANQLARVLRKKGVSSGTVVGIMVGRSADMIIGILGVLKAGGAYLPIDPDYPQKRIEYILEDSNTNIIITQRLLENKINFSGNLLYVEDDSIYDENYSNLDNINNASDLAYVIYTSGSTGKPKGVMITHKAIHNFIEAITEKIDFSPCKTILNVTTISFDIFVLETLLPLVKGMRIVIADEDEQNDPELLIKAIIENKVDMLQLTPSRAQLLLSSKNVNNLMANIKEIMIGGEAFPDDLLKKIKKYPKVKIYNMYGPTETTVWSCVMELTDQDKISIGKPILNTNVYILDEYRRMQPVGVPGEIYITGDGLAKGYYSNKELTDEKFVDDPFVKNRLMYRTGDIGKWTRNRGIVFLGRKDSQVKIRGYRIEIGEIEKVLNKHNLVKQCKVVVKEDSQFKKQLIAYIILNLSNMRYEGNESFSELEFLNYLKEYLPIYMIPSHIVALNSFPQTPNGKIDESKLPNPKVELNQAEYEYVEPSSENQIIITKVFREVLEINRIGIYDNFFVLGGDSMKVVQVVAKLNENGFNSKVKDIFRYPTVDGIARNVEFKNEKNYVGEVSLNAFQEKLLEQISAKMNNV